LEAANPDGLFQLSRPDSADELRQVLDETFNVTPPAPVEEIFTLIRPSSGQL
jgi:hypothetical protein